MDLLTLIGDTDENFYQLGLIDREKAKNVHRDVKLMFSTPWRPINSALEQLAHIVLKNSLLKKADYYRHLQSYADGMNIPLEQAAYVLMIPEMVSCMTKWAPGLGKGILGCSSFFMRNDLGQVVHGRIFDFPLQGSYDLNERAVLYDLKGMPKTLGFGASGIPYPSITLMTEDGMTLALHQKFTNVFNSDGISILALIFDLIQKANDKVSVLEYLKNHESVTTWCLYMTFKNGEALAVDIMGKEIYVNEFNIQDTGIHYFCNHLENKLINQQDMLPTGFHQYNVMRETVAQLKIEKFIAKKKKSESELIKMMTTPLPQKSKKPGHFEHYLMDTITPSSLSVMTMNPSSKECLYIGGEAPKMFRNNIIKLKNCFHQITQEEITLKNSQSVSVDYYEGIKSLMNAQRGFDQFNAQDVYHHLQLAIDHLGHYLECGPAKFYFLVAQYMFETHSKILMTVYHDLKKLEGKIPSHLNDHCLLFIGRLERILKIPTTINEEMIIHPKLRGIYKLELKIPRALFHITTKRMIVPRVDIMDVIYVYNS
jgi:hypothetical protein